jgi:general secretion pathway protein L
MPEWWWRNWATSRWRHARCGVRRRTRLTGLLADGAGTVALAAETLDARLLAIHRAPPVNLRQGVYAPRAPGFLSGMQGAVGADGGGRGAAGAGADAGVDRQVGAGGVDARGDALALAQRRFPAASDLDSAERLVAADMAKRGQGAANFTAPMAAVLAAMQPVPSIRLRDLGYSADGTLRFTAAAPRAEDVNAVLIALQNAGWKVTVPPSLASDPTRATVVAITVRAP